MPEIDIQETKVEDKPSPSDKQKVEKIVSIWDSLDTRWKSFYQEVIRNFEYLCDNQIIPEIRAQLKADERPELVFNFLLALVNYIAGVIATNKFKMRAIPIRMGDEQKAELHTVLNEWAMQNCDGDYEIARAAVMACIAKIGWTNNYWDASAPNGGRWVTKSYDPFMIRFDPDTKNEDLSDCRYMAVSGYYSAEEIIAIYDLDKINPTKAKKIRDNATKLEGSYPKETKPKGWLNAVFGGAADWWNSGKEQTSWYQQDSLIDNYCDARMGIYRVVEFHDRRKYSKKYAYNPQTRQPEEVGHDVMNDASKMKDYEDEHKDWFIFDDVKNELWITAVCPRLLDDDVLLEVPYPIQDKGFQFKPIFWHSFHPDLTRSRGILDNLISSQDYFNQRMMSFLEAVMRGVNPDWLVDDQAISEENLVEWQSKKRGRILKHKGMGKDNKPERLHPMGEVLNSLQGSAEMIFDLQPKLSGVSPNQMGFKESSKESGVLYNQRVQAGLTALGQAFAHIQRSMSQIYDYCDRGLQIFLTTPRAVRILGEPPKGMEGVVMNQDQQDMYWLQVNQELLDGVLNDVSQGEYDFKPDLTQLGQTAKQAKFMEGMELLKSIPPKFQEVLAPLVVGIWDNPIAVEASRRMNQVLEAEVGMRLEDQQTNLLGKQVALAGATKQLNAPQVPDGGAMAQQSLNTAQPQ
jgi:hypothetical protein